MQVFDSESEKLKIEFPVEELRLISQIAEIKSNILKIVFSETSLSREFFPTLIKVLDKKLNDKQQKLFALNLQSTTIFNENLSRDLKSELTFLIDEKSNEENINFEIFRTFEKIIIEFIQKSIGVTKQVILSDKLMPELTQLLLNFHQHVCKNLSEQLHLQMIKNSQFIGKYEASQEMLDKQREMTQQIIVENKLHNEKTTDIYEKRIVHMQHVIDSQIQNGKTDKNLEDFFKKMTNDHSNSGQIEIFQRILHGIESLRDEEHKIRLNLEEQIQLNLDLKESNRLSDLKLTHRSEIEQLKLENQQNLKMEKNEREQEILHLQKQVKVQEKRESDVLNLVLKRENEIKLLQEKIKSDEHLKATQMQFSTLICSVF